MELSVYSLIFFFCAQVFMLKSFLLYCIMCVVFYRNFSCKNKELQLQRLLNFDTICCEFSKCPVVYSCDPIQGPHPLKAFEGHTETCGSRLCHRGATKAVPKCLAYPRIHCAPVIFLDRFSTLLCFQAVEYNFKKSSTNVTAEASL